MKAENNIETGYKRKRDGYREAGNKFLATYYQILIVQEYERRKFSFRKKSDLKQHWSILSDLLNEILGTSDMDYQRGIYYETVLSGRERRLSGEEEECRICSSFFVKSANKDYIQGAYQLHISSILEIACEDVEAAQIYADNLLTLLKIRYGINSWQHAKMKLHIIGEYYYQYKREEFLYEFKKNYGYFKEYTEERDIFFCFALTTYAYLLEENADSEIWMIRCEEAVERKKEDRLYCLLKCKIAWIKAKALERENQIEAALGLLQEAIEKYLLQDHEEKTSFYGYVYLEAADLCFKLKDIDQMAYYAQEGLAICESLNQCDSELYFNLCNYVGIMYMLRHSWAEAEKLYSSRVQNIVQKLGKENEVYMNYMNHLAISALNQNKNPDLYLKELKSIKNQALKKRSKALFNNELNYSIERGDSIKKIGEIYKQCVDNMEGEDDKQEWERLDTLYLFALTNANVFNEQVHSLLMNLEERYKSDFADGLACLYWNSRLLWEWNHGNLQTALEISERLVYEMPEEEYEKYRQIIMNNIQLLILNGQYDKSKQLILSMMKLFHNRILDVGYGNISTYLLMIRILISLYIQGLKKAGDYPQLEGKEAKLLLEKIIYCKTIEREIKGSLGKPEEDEPTDWYYFKQNHRKLAALEMGWKMGKLDRQEYERKRMKCLLEMAEQEANLNRQIPFHKMIHEYKFETIEIPDSTVCVEYFVYYNFDADTSVSKALCEENEAYSYLAFVLSEERGQARILDIVDIPLERMLYERVAKLLDAAKNAENYDERETEETIWYLRQVFAKPVFKYLECKERVYLGLDFLQQMLPMDLIFTDCKGEPLNIIMVDSACYVEKDTKICIEKADALIIGNPKLNLHEEQKTFSLPCGEMECIEIASMFGTEAYVGTKARQRVLWGKEPKDVIHISTHGEQKGMAGKEPFSNDLFIDSYLELAGFEDWKEGRRDKDYGNGIVSGDDFLFMDLTRTKLVVLSACESGLGCFSGLSAIHGMRWAIGAAGAENSVTTLWEVPDDSSAILMIFFYRNLRTMPVGEALYEAKKRLRTATVSELRKDHTLKQIVETARKDEAGQEIRDDDKPYVHWKYWAGFVCYHR